MQGRLQGVCLGSYDDHCFRSLTGEPQSWNSFEFSSLPAVDAPIKVEVRSPNGGLWRILVLHESKKSQSTINRREFKGQGPGVYIILQAFFYAQEPFGLELATNMSPTYEPCVTIHQPVRFHLLRHLAFSDDAVFCELIRHCCAHDTSGGKSKSSFWRSEAGELVLKDTEKRPKRLM
eukprot:s1347_g5.t1